MYSPELGGAPYLVYNEAGSFVCLHHGGAGPFFLSATSWGRAPLFVCNQLGWGPFVSLHHGGSGTLLFVCTTEGRGLLFFLFCQIQ